MPPTTVTMKHSMSTRPPISGATATSGAPAIRTRHTAVWTGTEMIVWGGLGASTPLNNGGRYNPGTDTWTPTSLVNPPSLRWMHAAVWTGTEMIIQGGSPGNPVGGRYNPATDTWKATNPINAANNGQGITARARSSSPPSTTS